MEMATTAMIKELFQAAQTGDLAKLREFLKTDSSLANTENEEGLTLLGYAANLDHKEAVALLEDHGAIVQAVSHSKIAYIPSNIWRR